MPGNEHIDFDDRMVLTPECEKIAGMNRVSIWRKEKAKKFPRRIRLSGNKSAWRLSELRAWFADPENYKQSDQAS